MKIDRHRIVFTGTFRFPEGDAAAARVLGLGKTLRDLGYDVQFAGWEQRERSEDKSPYSGFAFQGFPYFSQDEFRTKKLTHLKRLLRYFFAGRNTIRWLKKQNTEDLFAVVAYHGGSFFLLRLALFCRLNRIKLIVDCTEWYDASGFPGGRFGVPHLDSEFRMRVVNPLIGNIVAISTYLRDYYRGLGCRVVCIPPTIDFSDEKWKKLPPPAPIKEGVRFVYAGIPGKKDVLFSVLLGIKQLQDVGIKVMLELVGPSKDELIRCADGDEELVDAIIDQLVFHGRVSQSKVPEILVRADFSILLRPERRSSAAGFSTKLVESLAAGVPVLANITGDIASYVTDGIEGILIKNESVESFIEGVKRALILSPAQLASMRAAARAKAEASFSYSNYSMQLKKFISNC